MADIEFTAAVAAALYNGQAGRSVQVSATEDGVEFGQKLGIDASPTFEGLSVIEQFELACDAILNAGLLVAGDAIFQGTIDANGELNVADNNITIGNVGAPTNLTADGGGLTLLGDIGSNKTILWLNALKAWTFNQDVAIQKALSVGALTVPVADASLDLKATDKALLHNRLTTVQRDALTPTAGMTIYNTTTNDFEGFNGVVWQSMGGSLIVGPALSTDNAVARFDGITGKLVQNSGVIIDDAGNVVIPGDLTVQGTTVTLDATTLLVEDKNIELGVVATPTDVTADGGGITLKGTTDKTIVWDNASGAWKFNQPLDVAGNITLSGNVDGVDVGTDVPLNTTHRASDGSDHAFLDQDVTIASLPTFAQLSVDNLRLDGNTLSATNANGDILLTPNGTGKVVVDNIRLTGNTIETSSGDLDLTSGTGGVFKFTNQGIRAGLDAVEYVEMGHGGGNGFINAVGDGGLDIRFEGVTLATFTDFGHLHLQTNVDQKHTLKIITNNNLNDTGIAWENSGGSFTHTIFRTDIGSNRADLVFAGGQQVDIDLLTNSFKIHGSVADAGRLEVLGTLQISSGGPGLDKVLTSDATGLATWQSLLATFLELTDTPSSFTGQAGKVVQVDAAGVGLEFGQLLRTTDSPTFTAVSVGDTGLQVGASVPFSDAVGILTLQGIDLLDAITEATIEAALDALPNLTSLQGQTVSLSGPLTVESVSVLNQDLTTDANPTFNDLVLTGDLTVQGLTTTLDTTTLLVEDKNIELGNVAIPTDITADGGGLTLLAGVDGDKTILWLNATDRWTFNQGIDLLGNTLVSTGIISADIMIASSQIIAGNLRLNGNTLSSDNVNGNIILAPNGTGNVVIDDLISNAGGVFKFTLAAFQAGQSVANFLEIGHGGATAFLNAVGVGGMDFRFEGVTKATLTDLGHLHLLSDVDQRNTLKIKTANNLNDTGIAWEDAFGFFTHTIFRTDTGNNQAGLVFAAGQDVNVNLLTNSFIIHGATGVEGKLEILGTLQISSGSPGTSKVLRSDANGIATWGDVGWTKIGTDVLLLNGNDSVGMGAIPDASAKLDVASTTKGFLPPRMTEAQRDAIGAVVGLLIFNTDIEKYEIFSEGIWKTFVTEDIGLSLAQETFTATNARFFGELGLPATQQDWVDVPTGSATIDLQDQLVFDVLKQVVRHNDNVSNGSTTSEKLLTIQNWTSINLFGASYGGVSRLDTVSGSSGFFSGLQANAAENPLATGNRRYGVLFSNSLGNIRLREPDAGGVTVDLDGTGGNPLILFDEWFFWECIVPAGLGTAQFFVNGALTTFAPEFRVNAGGLGTAVKVGSGSTSGIGRVVYHSNFGVTIFEEVATRTLSVFTMEANIVQVNIPEGRRDYTITLPDGSPRGVGTTLRVAANNLFGTVTLNNENPAAPQILYNGLREIVLDITIKEVIEGINTVDQGNVYIGFKDVDIDRAKSIFAQLSSNVDQIPVDTNPTIITYNTQDEINGIGHSTSLNPGELEILPGFGGVYFVSPQPQVGKDMGSVKTDFDMFWEIDRGSGFADEPNSNVKITIKDNDITTTASSAFTINLNVGDKIRMLQRVSNSTVGLGLKNTDPEVGPPTIPRTPSIILTMYRVGGIAA